MLIDFITRQHNKLSFTDIYTRNRFTLEILLHTCKNISFQIWMYAPEDPVGFPSPYLIYFKHPKKSRFTIYWGFRLSWSHCNLFVLECLWMWEVIYKRLDRKDLSDIIGEKGGSWMYLILVQPSNFVFKIDDRSAFVPFINKTVSIITKDVELKKASDEKYNAPLFRDWTPGPENPLERKQ